MLKNSGLTALCCASTVRNFGTADPLSYLLSQRFQQIGQTDKICCVYITASNSSHRRPWDWDLKKLSTEIKEITDVVCDYDVVRIAVECSHNVGVISRTVSVVCGSNCHLLWPLYVIGQAIIFLPCGFFLSYFFPCLISAVADWILPYFYTWCGFGANLGCRSETCCTRLAEKYRTQKVAIWAPSHIFVGLYLRN